MPDYFLSHGKHQTAAEGRCAMEWVAYLAGEPHTDTPECVSPLLARFCIGFNDGLPDDRRQLLRPYLARTIGTHGDGLDDQRAWMCTNWLIRTYAPAWLSLAQLDDVAEHLRSLPPVLAAENLERTMSELRVAKQRASAAGAAAGDAARAVAWAVAGDAAGAVAWAVAGAAARAAARAALQPTVDELQRSAFELLDRMLPTEVIQLPVVEDAELVCGRSSWS